MTFKINTPSGWTNGTPSKINTPSGWKSVEVVKVATPSGWKQVWPEDSAPPYLYDVEIEYAGNHVVNFTALSGFVHTDPTEEAYMFRCTEAPSLNGYVAKSFTKTFPVTAYANYNCTLQDVSGDIPAGNAKQISFTVINK